MKEQSTLEIPFRDAFPDLFQHDQVLTALLPATASLKWPCHYNGSYNREAAFCY